MTLTTEGYHKNDSLDNDNQNVYTNLGSDSEKKESMPDKSDAVFNKVYQQIATEFQLEHPDWSGEQILDKIAPKFSVTQWTIPFSREVIYQDRLVRMESHIRERYKDNPRVLAATLQTAIKYFNIMRTAVDEKVRNGEIDPILANTFLRYGSGHRHFSYSTIIKQRVNVEELHSKNVAFRQAYQDLYNSFPKESIEDHGFIHFNARIPGEVDKRIYISADLNNNPAAVLRAFQQTLDETGLTNKIYFKLLDELSIRQDFIIIYVKNSNSQEEINKLITTFQKNCSPALLSEKGVIAATEISRGISFAPEPKRINKLLSYEGREIFSYNSLIDTCFTMAFQIARLRAEQLGEINLTPKALKDKANVYFKQALQMAGINPLTMT